MSGALMVPAAIAAKRMSTVCGLEASADITALAFGLDAEYAARSAFTESCSRLRRNADIASVPFVSLPVKAAGSVMPPLESDVALFSI